VNHAMKFTIVLLLASGIEEETSSLWCQQLFCQLLMVCQLAMLPNLMYN